MKLRYFVDEKEVTYVEWAAWYETYVREEKAKLVKWIKRGV